MAGPPLGRGRLPLGGAGLALLAVVVALGITRVADWDAWSHLAYGRDLVTRGGFPAREPFVFPAASLPYHNTEWVFDAGVYLTYALGGFPAVVLLRVAVIALAFGLLWADARIGHPSPDAPWWRPALRLAVFVPLVLVARHRFVERPDIALMALLAFTIYALHAAVAEGRRRPLLALPLVAVVWANVHPSVVVAAVPFGAVLASGALAHLLARWRGTGPPAPPAAMLARIGAVFVAFALASLVNPRGWEAVLLPLRLTEAGWLRHQVAELQPPVFWQSPAPFVIIALLAVTFLLAGRRAWLSDVLLVAPFAVLALSAGRFIFLLAVVAAPVLARNVVAIADAVAARWPGRRAERGLAGAGATLVATGLLLVVLTLGGRGPFAWAGQVTGLGAHLEALPEGALRYLDANRIEGRVYNTFQWGGYLAWRDFPRRAPIVDGRGYLPPGLIEEVTFARSHPRHLRRLADAYGFDVAVVDYPVYTAGDTAPVVESDGVARADLALNAPDWALVHWDDVALVYLRRVPRHAALIARDEYRLVTPGNPVPSIAQVLADRAALPAVVAELERAQVAAPSRLATILLGFAALEQGRLDAAVAAFEQGLAGRHRLDALQGLALARWRQGDLAGALEHYRAIVADAESALMLYNAGLAAARLNDARGAIDFLERARRVNPAFVPTYALLAEVYRHTGDAAREAEVTAAQARALAAQQAAARLAEATRLQRRGQPDAARAAVEEALRVRPDSAAALTRLGDLELEAGRVEHAVARYAAATAADPTHADAVYGLARAHARQGHDEQARRHYEAFLRLAPRSYLAWQVRQTLARR
jgi:tetratricopeptide (TPR) repeat protein